MSAHLADVPAFGSPAFIAKSASMYRLVLEEAVFGPNTSQFIQTFCTDNMGRTEILSALAQEKCKGDEKALITLAGKVKYIIAHLEIAQCFGKQLGIMTEHIFFRQEALNYMAYVHAELQALEYWEPF